MIGSMKNPNNMATFEVQKSPKGRVGGTSVSPATAQMKPKGKVGGISKAPNKAMPC
jgi:hypothetical protein